MTRRMAVPDSRCRVPVPGGWRTSAAATVRRTPVGEERRQLVLGEVERPYRHRAGGERVRHGVERRRCSAIVGDRCAVRNGISVRRNPTRGTAIGTARSALAGPATSARPRRVPVPGAHREVRSAASGARGWRVATVAASAATRRPASGATRPPPRAGRPAPRCRRPPRATPGRPRNPAGRPGTVRRSPRARSSADHTGRPDHDIGRGEQVVGGDLGRHQDQRPLPRGGPPGEGGEQPAADRTHVGRPGGQRRIGQRREHSGEVLDRFRHRRLRRRAARDAARPPWHGGRGQVLSGTVAAAMLRQLAHRRAHPGRRPAP